MKRFIKDLSAKVEIFNKKLAEGKMHSPEEMASLADLILKSATWAFDWCSRDEQYCKFRNYKVKKDKWKEQADKLFKVLSDQQRTRSINFSEVVEALQDYQAFKAGKGE